MKEGRKYDDGKQVKEKNIGHDNGKEKRRVRKNTKRLNKWQKKKKEKKHTTQQRRGKMIREITCTYIATSPTTKLLGSAYRGHATAHEPPPLNWSLAISRDDLEGGGGEGGDRW